MGVPDPRSNRAAAAQLAETAPRSPRETDSIPIPPPGPLPSPNPSPSPASAVSDEHSSSSSSDSDSNSESESNSDEETPPSSPKTRASDLHPDLRGSNYAGQSETSSSSSNLHTPRGSSSATHETSSAFPGNTTHAAALSMVQLSSALQQQIGYSLAVQPSGNKCIAATLLAISPTKPAVGIQHTVLMPAVTMS